MPASRVLVIGVGDMGERFAAGLAASGRVGEVVLAGRPEDAVVEKATTLASAYPCRARAIEMDGRDQAEVEALLARERPDLVVQAASLQSPWALGGRDDAAARAFAAAGLAVRLPFQLPVLLSVMRAVRATGLEAPVANVSLPDITHPILARVGLAPTVGLGNVGMQALRVQAALRLRDPDAPLPLVRVVGHHAHVYGVMQATPPAEPSDRPRVYLGEEGTRDDALAYAAPALRPGIRYNVVTAAAALPVLLGLLPGAEPVRWSTPAPLGLPGGWPVRIAGGQVGLDLPDGADRDEVVAFHERSGRGDGLSHVDDDGTAHFTDDARAALADVAPDLAEPLRLADVDARAARMLALLEPRA
jgi:hypothetical protein